MLLPFFFSGVDSSLKRWNPDWESDGTGRSPPGPSNYDPLLNRDARAKAGFCRTSALGPARGPAPAPNSLSRLFACASAQPATESQSIQPALPTGQTTALPSLPSSHCCFCLMLPFGLQKTHRDAEKPTEKQAKQAKQAQNAIPHIFSSTNGLCWSADDPFSRMLSHLCLQSPGFGRSSAWMDEKWWINRLCNNNAV